MGKRKMVYFKQFETHSQMIKHMSKIGGSIYSTLAKAVNSRERAFYKIEAGNKIKLYEIKKAEKMDSRQKANKFMIEVIKMSDPTLSRIDILKLSIRRATAKKGNDDAIKVLRERLKVETDIKELLG